MNRNLSAFSLKNQARVLALSNLRPETILGAEGIPFELRAQAMPGVVDVRHSISDVDSIHPEGDSIEVKDLMPLTPEFETRMVVTDRHIVVGGVISDQDSSADNPIDGNGDGKIVHRGRRRGDTDQEREFYKAVGRDSDGNKDLTLDEVQLAAVENALSVIRKDRSAMTSLSNRCRARGRSSRWVDILANVKDMFLRAGWAYAMDELASELFDERYWTRVSGLERDPFTDLEYALREDEVEKVWERLLDEGKIGSPLAVMLDIYEHSAVSYSISGEGMQCRWDTSGGAAAWIPDADAVANITGNVLEALGFGKVKYFGACGSESDPLRACYSLDGGVTWSEDFPTYAKAQAALLELARPELGAVVDQAMRKEASRYVRAMLDGYNNWANGWVYGVVVYVIDRHTGEKIDDHDVEDWGILGSTDADSQMEDTILSLVADLTKTVH